MKRILSAISAVMLMIVIILPSSVNAQGRGILSGRVIDKATNAPLTGAQVFIKDSNYGSVTNYQGRYRIAGLESGSYTLVVSYLGYERVEKEVSVAASESTFVNVELASIVIEGDMIVVEGSIRQGQAEALNRQKNADEIKNVVAEDMIELFPDPNVAEALQRIPGISIERDQGEGRYVLIRGLQARLNNTQVNGISLPSPESEIRQVAMDVIPADLLNSIEVTKAITPEMDANAIGGSVNILTKTARDYDKSIVKGSFAGGYNDIVDDGIVNLALTLGTTFGTDDKWGFLVSTNYYKTNRGSQNNEFSYTEQDFGNGDQIVIDEYEIRDYMVNRTRFGITSTLDYQFHENSMVYLTGIYNWFDDYENRRLLMFAPGAEEYTSATSAVDAEMERELKDRKESQTIYNAVFGGKHLLENHWDIDYRLSYAYGEESEPVARYATFVQEGLGMSWNSNETDFPVFNTGGAEFNYDDFELDEMSIEDNLTTNSDITGNLNFEVPLPFKTTSGMLKFGAKFSLRDKDNDKDARIYGWEGDDDITLAQLTGEYTNPGLLDGHYDIGLSPGPAEVKNFFNANRDRAGYLEEDIDDSNLDSDPSDYDAGEDIYAGYMQMKLDFGSEAEHMLLFGARVEHTTLDYTGYQVVEDEDGYAGTTKVSNDNSYTDIFPSLHYKYTYGKNTNFRAAVTSAIARPNFYDLVPYRIVNREDNEAEIGNIDLKPTYALGFDLMVDHYFEPFGVISGGFFYKNLSDYIFITGRKATLSGYEDDGEYEIYQPVNGDEATLYGFELNWQYQLTMLPGFWNGFGLYANYTWTDSEADFPIDIGETRTGTLPGQAENVANFAVSYDKYGFSGRVSMNYHGEFIDAVGISSDFDEYYDNHIQWDFSASQKLNDKWKIYADLVNIGDEPLRYYVGNSSRPRQQEYYSWWGHFGVKFEL